MVKTDLSQLNSHYSVLSTRLNQQWSTQKPPEAGLWVDLLELPSNYSFHQALLLCQCADKRWLAWIPDHGEALLERHQFCQINENGLTP